MDLSDLDQDTEALMKITYDAFEDAVVPRVVKSLRCQNFAI